MLGVDVDDAAVVRGRGKVCVNAKCFGSLAVAVVKVQPAYGRRKTCQFLVAFQVVEKARLDSCCLLGRAPLPGLFEDHILLVPCRLGVGEDQTGQMLLVSEGIVQGDGTTIRLTEQGHAIDAEMLPERVGVVGPRGVEHVV